MRRKGAVGSVAVSAVIVLFTGCTTAPAAQPPSSADNTAAPPSFAPLSEAAPTDVVAGLHSPWSIVFAGDTPLVSERDTGRVLEVGDDGSTREVGTVDGIQHGGEGGLLGLALDDEDRLYAYSTGSTGNRIQRFALGGGPGGLTLGDGVTLLENLPANTYHNGGRIAFGPDGMLYAGVGDAGDRPSAQDLDSPSGKILRMTPDGDVPDDNPFPGSLVYSSGHRNVQGLAWAADGTMFASEFGQDTWDELNIIEAGGNYGWPEVEGLGGGGDFIDPVQQWAPADASPSGIAVVDDILFIANLRGERLRAVPVTDPAAFRDYYTAEYGRIRAVTPAPDGSLWFLTGNTNTPPAPGAGDDRILSVELAGPAAP